VSFGSTPEYLVI